MKNRLHLDLRVGDHDATVERAIAMGATPADDVFGGHDRRVLRECPGKEFCMIRLHE